MTPPPPPKNPGPLKDLDAAYSSAPPSEPPPIEVDSKVLSFLSSALRRALVPMYLLAMTGLVTAGATVVGTINLVMSLSRVETMAVKLEELTRSVERVERTAESTETKVDATQDTIEKQPVVDFEVQTAEPTSPRATAKPTTFMVVRPRKPLPVTAASAAPSASVEIKLPLPTAEPEKK